MSITLRPEHEHAIAEAIKSGAYRNPDEVIERALEALRSQDQWLLENRNAIRDKIDRATAQLERGEGIRGEDLAERLQSRKTKWLAEQKG